MKVLHVNKKNKQKLKAPPPTPSKRIKQNNKTAVYNNWKQNPLMHGMTKPNHAPAFCRHWGRWGDESSGHSGHVQACMLQAVLTSSEQVEENLETWIHETGQERKNSNSGTKTKYMCVNLTHSSGLLRLQRAEVKKVQYSVCWGSTVQSNTGEFEKGWKIECESRVWFRDRGTEEKTAC